MIDNKKTAFTLIETMIAVAIFALVILTASRIFQSVLDNQKINTVDQAVQENVKYFLESLTREARTAVRNTSGTTQCNVTDGHVFAVNATSSELYFSDPTGACLIYFTSLDNDVNRLAVQSDANSYYLTSRLVDINSLKFVIDDVATTTPPFLTVNVQVKSEDNQNIPAYNIQTSISSLSY